MGNDTPLAVGGPKPRALLALLLLHANEAVSRDRLLEELWGDRAVDSGHSLDVQISRLRKALGADVLHTRGGGYVLETAPESIDALRFRQLVDAGRDARAAGREKDAVALLDQALALWRGPALADFAYEDFARPEIERLEELRMVAVEERIDARLALGEHATLCPELEALVREHPLRERLRSQLMLALYRSGRQADALHAYSDGRRLLAEEQGIEPGGQLRELEKAILRQDPALGKPAPLPEARRRRRRRLLVAPVLLAVTVGAAVAGVLLATGGTHEANARVLPDSTVFVDAASGKVRAGPPIRRPGYIKFGLKSFWVVNDDGVLTQIDPKTLKTISSVGIGISPGGLALGAGSVWVSDANGSTLLRIDPRSNVVERRLALPSGVNPATTNEVAYGAGSIWVAHGGQRAFVERIDPESGNVQHRFPIQWAHTLTFGQGAVWVGASGVGTIYKIDPATNTFALITTLHPWMCCLAVGGGYLWASVDADHEIWKISRDGSPQKSIKLSGGAGFMDYANGALWVTADGSLSRIDPVTDSVTSFEIGHVVVGVAVGKSSVAVGIRQSPEDATAGLHGDIARLTMREDWLENTDPAVMEPFLPWQEQFHYATCAKLYNYPDREGRAGLAVIPEVAAAPPEVSPDGLRYAFHLRSGYRFSPPSGARVDSAAFRTALERVLSPKLGPNAPGAPYIEMIAGAAAYRSGRVQYLAGVTANGDTLTIRLTHRVPNLAEILALPYFCAVPPRTPAFPNGLKSPIPSAGPYYLSAHDEGTVAVLRRNPNYHGPRPQHVDAFVYSIGIATAPAAAAIARGRQDYAAEFDPALEPGAASTADPRAAYHRTQLPITEYLVLNANRPTFSQERLRRAASLAIDRTALAVEAHGLASATILPPNLARLVVRPGSVRVAEARRLAETAHATVVLAICKQCQHLGQIVQANLARIGVTVKLLIVQRPLDVLPRVDLALGVAQPDGPPEPRSFLATLPGLPRWAERRLARLESEPVAGRTRGAYAVAAELERRAYYAPFATFYVPELFSARVGCKVFQPLYFGVDLAALCLKSKR
jgi:DNA-binding SARP family transcriptional activator/DNA-binding beta-propeller fold protein YncE